jgi:hypothetical protein
LRLNQIALNPISDAFIMVLDYLLRCRMTTGDEEQFYLDSFQFFVTIVRSTTTATPSQFGQPSSSPNQSESSSSPMSNGAIAGVVAGGGFLVVAAALSAVIIKRGRAKLHQVDLAPKFPTDY